VRKEKEKQREKAVKPFFIHSVLNSCHSSTTKRLSQQLNAYRGKGWRITDIYFPYSSANTKSVCVCDEREREIVEVCVWECVNGGVVLLEPQFLFQESCISTKCFCTLSEVILC